MSRDQLCSYYILLHLRAHKTCSLGLWCVTKSGLYTTISDRSVTGLRRNCKTCSRAKLTPSGLWTQFGGLLLIWPRFLNSCIITSAKNAQQMNQWDALSTAQCNLHCLQKGLSLLHPSSNVQEAAPCTSNTSEGEGIELWRKASAIFTWLLRNQLLPNHLSNCLQDKYFCSQEDARTTSNSPSTVQMD